MVAGFVQFFTPESVFACAIMVLVMFIALTLYAAFTRSENLQWCWAAGAVLGLAIWPLIIFCWIFPSNMLYNFLYVLIIVLTAIYIVYDTKLIMEKLNLDEYIIGALLLYVDLIQAFMILLSLFGGRN